MVNAQSGTEQRPETEREADTVARRGDRIGGQAQSGVSCRRPNGAATLRGAVELGPLGEELWRGGSVDGALTFLAMRENDREVQHAARRAILATAPHRSDLTGAAQGWPARATGWLRNGVASVRAWVRRTGPRRCAPAPGEAWRCSTERAELPSAGRWDSVVR
jgi:hypothetical protein